MICHEHLRRVGCLFDPNIFILAKTESYSFIPRFSSQCVNRAFDFVLLLSFLGLFIIQQRYLFDLFPGLNELTYSDSCFVGL